MALWEGKFKFLEQQRDTAKKDYDDAMRNFQATTNGTNSTGNSTLATNIGMKAQTVDFRKYYGQVSGSVQTALFDSFLAFISIISATML